MFKDYVGETEEDAINTAIEDLHIERADFDVEVLKTVKKGLFKKTYSETVLYPFFHRTFSHVGRTACSTIFSVFLYNKSILNRPDKRAESLFKQNKRMKQRGGKT